jgi:tetratricopeptide (TPR) repeat protein
LKKHSLLKSYSPSVLPDYSEKLVKFVIENRAEELSSALNHLQENKILLFSGIAGVGKTTLSRVLVNFRPTGIPEPFWFNFYHNRDAKLEDVLEALEAYLGAPEILSFKGERQAGNSDINRLTEELRKRNSLWLVFDDLSYIINEKLKFIDSGLGLLFKSLRDNSHNAKIILTSRVVPLLENGEYLIDELEDENRKKIEGLKIEFSVNYLRANGFDDIELKTLESLVESVGGHPFSLKLLAGLAKKHTAENILKDLSLFRKRQKDRIKNARFLFDKLVGEEKELLERISVFRKPEPLEAIRIMFTDSISVDSVDTLLDKSLLETDQNGSYWLHPLTQEFSYEDLKNKKEVHMLAYRYYKSLNLPENPTKKEELQPAIEAHYHACEAGEYDLAAHIILRYNLHYLLDIWGDSKILIEIYEKLLPEDHFKGEPVLKNKKTHRFILASMGNAYSHLGEPRKAIEYYKQALITSKEIEDKQGEGAAFGNLGNEYSHLGEFRKAIKYYEKSLKIARERRSRYGESAALGNLGTAYTDLREPRKAIEYYEQALKISIEIGDRRGESTTLGNIGTTYREMGEPRKAIEYYEQALKIDREIGDRCGEGRNLENMGLAFSLLGEHTKAIEYCEQALKIARGIFDRIGESETLGNMGSIYYYRKEFRQAIKYYEQALEINRKIGDEYGQAVDLRNMGNAYSALGEPRKAIKYYEQALEISIKLKDGCELSEKLIMLWIVYCNPSEPRETVEFLKKYFAVGKAIDDSWMIGFCEQKLKELEGPET